PLSHLPAPPLPAPAPGGRGLAPRRLTHDEVTTMSKGYHQAAFWTLYEKLAELADRKIGWHRLPVPLGLAVLIGIRDVLRKNNLYDTSGLPAANVPPVPPATPEVRTTRSLDGTYNDLAQPRM